MDEKTITRIEQLLEETLEVAQENNELLLSIQRTARWAFWGKLLLWIVVLGLPILFIGPILKALVPVPYTDAAQTGIFGLPSADQLRAVMEAYEVTGADESAP